MTSPYFERVGHATAKAHTTLLLSLMLAMPMASHAGPGTHGPNGEHLDGPPTSAKATASAVPTLEAHSETFELVARLAGGELSMLIDRYNSNEPVLNGQVEVESAGIKAIARFHADHGDYAIDDVRLLEALAKPGQHPLVITITAGEEADLLDGVLVVEQAVGLSQGHDPGDHADPHEHGSGSKVLWVVGGLTLLAALAWAGSMWRKALRQGQGAGSPANTAGKEA